MQFLVGLGIAVTANEIFYIHASLFTDLPLLLPQNHTQHPLKQTILHLSKKVTYKKTSCQFQNI